MKLYPHQQQEVEQHGESLSRGLLWCPRAGKSRATLVSAMCLRDAGVITRVLISSPNGVHENWMDQELRPYVGDPHIWQWNTQRSDVELKAELDRLDPGFQVWSIPSHLWTLKRAQWFFRRISGYRDKMLLVADESHEYSSPSAKRSRRIRAFAYKCKAKRILTGTPWHDSILHAWAQLEILAPGTSGSVTHGDFSRRYGVWETRFGPHGSFPSLVGYQHVGEFMTLVREHCSIITAADIPDMPRTVNRLINLDLPPKVRTQIDADIAELDIDVAAVIFGQIHQMVGLDATRLDTTARLAQRWPYTVIWCRYRAEIRELATRLPGATIWYGGTAQRERTRIMKTLRAESPVTDPMILIAQPQSCGQGVDFSRAQAMIFHSHTPSVRLHEQALNRVTAVGAGTTPVYYLCNSGIDAHIIQRLRLKSRFARLTLGDIEDIQEYSIVPKENRLRRLWNRLHSDVDIRRL